MGSRGWKLGFAILYYNSIFIEELLSDVILVNGKAMILLRGAQLEWNIEDKLNSKYIYNIIAKII